MLLSITIIRTDGGTQPRASIDQAVVEDYAEAIKGGAKFPPADVFFDGDDYWLADGFHRRGGYALAGETEMPVDLHQGSRREAQWFSFAANKHHGLKRDREDSLRILDTIACDSEWATKSVREISAHTGIAKSTVQDRLASVRSRTDAPATRKVARKGKTYTMKTAAIGRSAPVRHVAADAQDLPDDDVGQIIPDDEPDAPDPVGDPVPQFKATPTTAPAATAPSELGSDFDALNPAEKRERLNAVDPLLAQHRSKVVKSAQAACCSLPAVRKAVELVDVIFALTRKPFSQISTIDLRKQIEQLRDAVHAISPAN